MGVLLGVSVLLGVGVLVAVGVRVLVAVGVRVLVAVLIGCGVYTTLVLACVLVGMAVGGT